MDVDGTLLDPSHRLTQATHEAVARLHAAGVRVILATSRYPGAVRAIHADLRLGGDPIVCCQGAVAARLIGSGLAVLVEHRLDLPSARLVVTRAQTLGYGVSYYDATSWRVERGDPFVDQESVITGVSPTVVRRLRRVRRPPAKITIVAPGHAVADLPLFAATLPPTMSGSISRPDYLEVVPTGVSKWTGVRAVLRDLGIAETETAAIGDGENDLEMIIGAGIGIAMGHAPERLRLAAARVVGTNQDDGFAAVVEMLLGGMLVGPGA